MRVVRCPEVYRPTSVDELSLFLGGGISNCPDWQEDMTVDLVGEPNLVLLNPRRTNFDISNPEESDFQISWEYEELHIAHAVSFWFPMQTLCPITLYELGVHAASGKKMFVGCHPDYQRRFDVIKQLSLIRPEIQVRNSLRELVQDVKLWRAGRAGNA